jgi:hypothetical protein
VAWLKRRERLLFRTHESPFGNPAWAVGRILQYEGELYRVTRWVELRPVLLERGGSVGEWEVWGRRLSREEVKEELNMLADQMDEGDAS